jgi:hypothetical protein
VASVSPYVLPDNMTRRNLLSIFDYFFFSLIC